MRLQAPENCSGASYAGEPIKLDEKGQCIVTSEAAIEALKIHGFTEVPDEPLEGEKPVEKKVLQRKE